MVEKRTPFYPHRQNRDKSFDSICLKCFATVANAMEVTELKSYEREHVCDLAALARRDRRVKAVVRVSEV